MDFIPIMLIVFCCSVAAVIVIAIVARLEKRMVWPYGNVQPQPHFPDSTGYGARWVNEAIQNGFLFLGWAPDLKGEQYKLTYAMLISPEKDCLAVIGIGHIWKLPLHGTWLHTLSLDGRHSWYSTDNQSCVEIDISGCKKSHLASVKSFGNLWRRHQEWAGPAATKSNGFRPFDNLEVLRQFRQNQYLEMASRKLICFCNPEQTHWRYTWYAAIKLSTLNHLIGLLRAFSFGRFPKGA